MRRFLYLSLIFGMLILPQTQVFGANEPVIQDIKLDMREYDSIEIPAGTFIPVVSNQEISTQYCPVGYKVRFTCTNDLFIHETNVIPENTEFYGYIEKLNEPVVGTNGSMVIKITKMILPDGFEIPIRGYIHTSNNNIIGGGLSAPAEWIKMPHNQSKIGINSTLQIRPGRARKLGEHTVIQSGENRIIILTDVAEITHTLTN